VTKQTKKKLSKPAEFVRCPSCGNEQADMGRNVMCEQCGELMPTDQRGK
jgi:ribosomal protein S27E